MKKFFKYATLLCSIFILLLINYNNVNASTEAFYSRAVRDSAGNVRFRWSLMGKPDVNAVKIMKWSNSEPVYCIEPALEYLDLSQGSYNYTDNQDLIVSTSQLTKDVLRQLKLLSYFGYGYGDHTDDSWYLSTQLEIWNVVAPNCCHITSGDSALIESQRAEIRNLVNGITTLPSFQNGTYTQVVAKPIEYIDANNVISNYSVSKCTNCSASISGNKLIVTANQVGKATVDLTRTVTNSYSPSIVYYNSNYQKLMEFGSPDPMTTNVNFNIVGGKIKITKVDSETNATTPQGQASLIGATYNVYDSNNNIVDSLTIGSDNTATTDHLPLGTYTVKEVSNSTGYYLDGTTYTVKITDSNVVNLTVKETVIKGKIKITKQDSETNSCKAQGDATLVGAKYGVYDHNNNLVDTLTIGSDCTATSKSLPYGKYSVKELNASTGYYIDASVYDANIKNSNTINITSRENIIKGKIKVIKYDSETTSCKAQGEATLVEAKYGVYNKINELVDTLTIGSDCTATSKSLPYGSYSIKELSSSEGYLIDTNIYNLNIINSNVLEVISKEDVIKGRIKITKVDSETNTTTPQGDAKLIGAKYGVYNKNNELVDTLIIGEDSTATTKLLPYGSYSIKELENSTGYYLNTEVYSEFIKETVDYSLTVKEEVIKNNFKFYKFYGNVDTGFIYAEPNATFKILNNEDEEVLTFTTNKDGFAEVTLPYGSYKLYQIKGLDDYKLMFPFSVRVTEDTALTQTNYLKNGSITAKLRLVKIDSETKMPIKLAGVTFKIRNKKTNEYICQTTNKVICEFETNNEGILITPLPLFAGDYLIEEITAPNGYLLSNKSVEFSIKENTEIVEDSVYGSLIELSFENDAVKGKIDINKTGEKLNIENGTYKYETIKLEGAIFEVRASEDIILNGYKYYSKDELVATLTSNKDGFASIDNLPLGKYYIKEISSSNDNMIDNKVYKVELSYKNQYTSIVSESIDVKNYLPKGTLEFVKVDLDGNVIPDTVIEIYNNEDQLIFTGKTDKNGRITINDIKVGKYFIKEKKSATGFVLSEDIIEFEIKENEELVKVTMKNKHITGSLEFSKIDFVDGTPIPDTLIQIFNDKDELVFEGMTDPSGMIKIDELKFGKYYIIEKEPNTMYQITDEKVYFEILENGEIVKATMTNEKIPFEVPNTSISESKLLNVIVMIAIVSGIGFIIYDSKKKK